MEQIAKEQKKQAEGSAGAMGQASQNIKNAGTAIFDIIGKFIQPLMPILTGISTTLTGMLEGSLKGIAEPMRKMTELMLKNIAPVLQNIANWFGDTWKELSAVEGFDGVMAVIKKKLISAFEGARDLLLPLFVQLRPAIASAFESVISFLKPYFADVIDMISEKFNEWLFNLPLPKGITGAKDPAIMAAELAVRKAQRDLESLTERQKSIKTAAENNENGATNSQDAALKILATEIREANAKLEAAKSTEAKVVKEKRHFGTSGILGMISEPKDTTVDIQAGERVLNPKETLEHNSLHTVMQSVNTNLATMIALQRENNNQNRTTLGAMRDLNGNLFAT
jgi:hypothetical protein